MPEGHDPETIHETCRERYNVALGALGAVDDVPHNTGGVGAAIDYLATH